jgi:hypothetical protein
VHLEQFGGRRESTTEQHLDARQSPARGGYGELLARVLEQQGSEEIHHRKLGHPPLRVEVRPGVNEARQHWIGLAEVGAHSVEWSSRLGMD